MNFECVLNQKSLNIKNEVIQVICSFKQNSRDKNESGGILMGYILKNEKGIVVQDLTVPQKHDIQSRFYFYRDNRIHQKILYDEWLSSKKTISYLGEWHTHPENFPTPSHQDLKNWRSLLENNIYLGDTLFFIICGIKKIVIWEGNRMNKKILKIGEIKI